MKWLSVFALALLTRAEQPADPPTFTHDVAPIVYKECAPCHRPGEAGPFSLLTYEEVRSHARQIKAVTQSRFMPPWLPQPGHGDFLDEHRMTDQQIRIIADWTDHGTPEGPAAAAPSVPTFTEGWQLGPPDLILGASHLITLSASGPDLYWNFVFDPQISRTRYVRAVEIRPGDKRVVHHANLIIDRAGSARKLEASPGFGFPGMDVALERSVFDPDSHFLFWKPGALPYAEPPGFSWRLDLGNLLVLNTHLQPSGKPETIQPSVGLYFTDDPPTRFPLLLQMESDQNLSIPPGVPDFQVRDNLRLPEDVDVLAIYPHAHYLGKRLEAFATLPGGSRIWLVRILDWDPNWQGVYRYRTPIFLPKGSVISMSYCYDNSAHNSRNPSHPPRRVVAGNRATDEMAHLWLQILPRGTGDRRRLVEETLLAHRLQKSPDDATAHLDLGMLMLSRLETQKAIPVLETAVRLDPRSSQARNMLGSGLLQVGRLREAIQEFQLAIASKPDNVNAKYNLAIALVKSHRFPEAAQDLCEIAAAVPNDARARNMWGEVLFQEGKAPEALSQFDQALAINPDYEEAKENRAVVLRALAAR